jgi:hypothetical protein
VGLHESPQKILACADYYYPAFAGGADSIFAGLSSCAVYLYVVLGGAEKIMREKKNRSTIFANIVFGTMAVLFVLALTFTWYRSALHPFIFNFGCGLVFSFGLIFSIFAFYIRSAWKINLAVTVFFVVLSIYGVEIVLWATGLYSTSINMVKLREAEAKKKKLPFDTRTAIEVIEDLRANGVDAWPTIAPYLFLQTDGLPSGKKRVYPLGGLSNKRCVYCNKSGDWTILNNDKHGFNNPVGLYKKGLVDVALVGDSFTHGACVCMGEDITGQLRKIGFKSLNLGISGNGPLIELATIKEYAEPLQPNVVLWIYYEGNDLENLEREKASHILMCYMEDDFTQNLLGRQSEIDTVLTEYVDEEYKQKLLAEQQGAYDAPLICTIKLYRLRTLLKSEPEPEPEPLFSKILTSAKKRVNRWGGALYFIYLPEWQRYAENKDENFNYRNDVLEIVRDIGISVIDFHEVLDSHPDPLSLFPFRLHGHYTAEGYSLVAKQIANRLTKAR